VTVSSTSFALETVDFSAISGLDNQPNIYLRVEFSGYTDMSPTLATSTGNNRIDNVQFNAKPLIGYVPNVQLGSDDTSGTTIYSNSVQLNSDVGLTAGAGGTVNFSGQISDVSPGNYVVKTGAGTVLLSTQESYSGPTSVLQGTLALGVAHAIDSSSGVSLGGGTLATHGNSQTLGLLNLAASSTIDMGNAGTVSFTASSSTTGAVGVWTPGAILRISDWKGNASNPTIAPAQTPFEVGNSPSTKLNSGELAQIHFTGYLTGAQELSDFEIVPLSTTRLLLGDVDRNQHVNAADIVAMENAFKNLSSYQTSHGFDSADMSDIFDVNGDGQINNADLQALETYLIGGHGSLGVPEPSSVVLGLLGAVSLAGVTVLRRRSQISHE
jgi:autotransporter-associated beta strand protein